MEFAWNTKKNKITDVKGLQMEQDREGKITNKEIDLTKTHLNYDLADKEMGSSSNLYHRVKKRVEAVRSVSRIQKNSVVDYSNIITVSKEQAKIWGMDKTKDYLKNVYDYFCHEFGKENVVSAKVHLDETSPHMHLHIVPVNLENGKLQSSVVMTPIRINKVHTEAPKYLREKGFEVERGCGKTEENLEIKKYKLKKLEENIKKLEEDLKLKDEKIKTLTRVEKEIDDISKIEFKKNFIGGKISMSEKDFENLKSNFIKIKKENLELKSINIKNKSEIERLNLDNKYLKKDFKELENKIEKNNFYQRQLDYNYNLIFKSLEGNKEVGNYVYNKALNLIYKENKSIEKQLIEKNKIEERLLNKIDNLKIKINLDDLKDKNIFEKKIYSVKEFDEKFLEECIDSNENFKTNVLLERQEKVLVIDTKMNFENKSFKNQILNNKKIIQCLKKEFKPEFDIQDKLLNKNNTIKNTHKNSVDFDM